jgi:hypothetical protein
MTTDFTELTNAQLLDRLLVAAINSQRDLLPNEKTAKDDADELWSIKFELLRRLNGWKDIALHLGDVLAANAECVPKSTSKRERERLAHICEDTLLMYQVGDVVGHRKSEESWVKERLASNAAKIRKELGS